VGVEVLYERSVSDYPPLERSHMATSTKKSKRSPREEALLPVKSIPAKERTARQKLERRLLHSLYSARTAKDPKAKEAHKKEAAKLEREIKALDNPKQAHKAA
jgi:hypothetical protein